MSTITLTKQNFDQVVEDHEMVVIDVSAEWCEPCKTFELIYEEISDQYPGVVFGSIDADQESDLIKDFNIRSIPQVMIVRENIVVFSEAGVMPAVALAKLIEDAKGLDMDQVRAQIEKNQ